MTKSVRDELNQLHQEIDALRLDGGDTFGHLLDYAQLCRKRADELEAIKETPPFAYRFDFRRPVERQRRSRWLRRLYTYWDYEVDEEAYKVANEKAKAEYAAYGKRSIERLQLIRTLRDDAAKALEDAHALRRNGDV